MLSKLTSLHCLLSYLKACAIACGLGLGQGGGGEGGGACAITTNRAWCFQIIDVKMPAVIHYCNLNVARGSLVSNLILELSNKRLSIMQLGILLCQPAVQSF